MFPTSIFAALLKCKRKDLYAAEEAEKANVDVGRMFNA
jgi:hypothetical protein